MNSPSSQENSHPSAPPPNVSARRFARLLTNMALASAAGLAALALSEAALALFPIVSPAIETLRAQRIKLCQFERAARAGREAYQSLFMTDPELGYRIRPDFVTGRKRVGSSWVEIKTDSCGFFNQDYDASHPCDVACVGDSFVAPPWPNILQDISKLRVAGFGVPAYSPPQYSIVVRRYALPLRPKVLLYCLYVNDAVESARFEDWKRSGLDWFTFRGRDWFGITPSHPGRMLVEEWLLRCSRIYALWRFAGARNAGERISITAHPIPYKTDKFSLVFDRASFTTLTDVQTDMVKRGLAIVRDSLDEARQLCEAANVRMIVLFLPPKELVHFEALKARAKPDDPIGNLPAFYLALQQICALLQIECCDLTDSFRGEVTRTGKALYGEVDIHWDEDGMNQMARTAAAILAASGQFRGKTKWTEPAPPIMGRRAVGRKFIAPTSVGVLNRP